MYLAFRGRIAFKLLEIPSRLHAVISEKDIFLDILSQFGPQKGEVYCN